MMHKMTSRETWYLYFGTALGLFMALLILLAVSATADAADFGGYVGGSQTGDDLQTVQIGLTVEWKYVEFDLSHGIQKTQWRVPVEPDWEMDEWQSGTTGSFRIYPFRTETIRPLLLWTHVSDLARGRPFNEDKNEPTSDYFGAGVTIETNRFEFDLTYGTFGRECKVIECASGSRTNEVKLSIRGYFWK